MISAKCSSTKNSFREQVKCSGAMMSLTGRRSASNKAEEVADGAPR